MSAARAKGTAWESAIVRTLVDAGWPHAERRALAGNADRGDIAGVAGVCIEAKSATRLDLAGWIGEVTAETVNARARIGAVWAKRRGKSSPLDGYVVMTGATFLELIREPKET